MGTFTLIGKSIYMGLPHPVFHRLTTAWELKLARMPYKVYKATSTSSFNTFNALPHDPVKIGRSILLIKYYLVITASSDPAKAAPVTRAMFSMKKLDLRVLQQAYDAA